MLGTLIIILHNYLYVENILDLDYFFAIGYILYYARTLSTRSTEFIINNIINSMFSANINSTYFIKNY